MSLKSDIIAITDQFDQHDAQRVDQIELIMIDCQECEYHDSFEDPDVAELYIRGHALVSRHYNIDIGVELGMRVETIDCTITVGDTIES